MAEWFKPPGELRLDGDLSRNFKEFRRELQIYFTATETHKKSQEVQTARLLNLIGADARRVIDSLDKPKKTVEQILDALEDECVPARNEVVIHFKFFKRVQKPQESFDHWYRDLRSLIADCEFGDAEDKILRTQIVLGIHDQELQAKLLRANQDLMRCVTFCQAYEAGEKFKNEIRPQSDFTVDKVGVNQPGTSGGGSRAQTFSSAQSAQKSDSAKLRYIRDCRYCSRNHPINACPAYGGRCMNCQAYNHYARCCPKSKSASDDKKASEVTRSGTASKGPDIESLLIEQVERNGNSGRSCWIKTVKVEGKYEIAFKIDTGSEINALPFSVVKNFVPQSRVSVPTFKLTAYGGFKISPIGVTKLDCTWGDTTVNADFILVEDNCSPILGLKTSQELGLIKLVNSLGSVLTKDQFLERYRCNFTGLGCFPGTYHLQLKKDSVPVCSLARRVPIKLQDKLKTTLDALVERGVIEPMSEPSEWVSNLVIVQKSDGSLRLCLDPSELNKWLVREPFVIPTLEDISPKLEGKKFFCLFDLKDGFYHIKLDVESSKLCTFSTCFGNYKFLRMPFGVHPAPEIFMAYNQKYFGDLKNVVIYFDDIVAAADTEQELMETVDAIMERAAKFDIKFNPSKLQYFQNEVKFVGFLFNEKGMAPDQSRVLAVQNLKNPTNRTELQQIFGFLNYLRAFIPNFSELTSPMRRLLKKDAVFAWTDEHSSCLTRLKSFISEQTILNNFKPNDPVTIECDSSKDAVGFALFQGDKPVCYGSSSLTTTQQNWAQIEKEYYAIVYACEKLRNYIFGHADVTVITDHSPLLAIHRKKFDEVKNNRLKRLKLRLLDYQFELTYKPGTKMYTSDLLSRNIISGPAVCVDERDLVHSVSRGELIFSQDKLKLFVAETAADPVLSKVSQYYQNGWPSHAAATGNNLSELNHFYKLKDSLTVEDGLVFLDCKLVVPVKLRSYMLKLLHESHLSIPKTKEWARGILYWPNMTVDIQHFIEACYVCQRFSRSNIKEPLISHEIPNVPYFKVGFDIAEFAGKNYLVVVDYYSRWIELAQLRDKSAKSVIELLKGLFSQWGIPAIVVSDNNPSNSIEFREFAARWGFKHVTSSPLYSQSNGLAEKGVDIAKSILKKCAFDNSDLHLALLAYRCSPLSGLGVSPAQLVQSRELRTKLPIFKDDLLPKTVDVYDKMMIRQRSQKEWYDQQAKKSASSFAVGDKVLLREKDVWIRATVVRILDQPRSYLVKTERGNEYRRNVTFLKKWSGDNNNEQEGRVSDSASNDWFPRRSQRGQKVRDWSDYIMF